MRRLGRWTLNALTVLSLVLCVATVGLRARAAYGTDIVSFVRRDLSRQRGSFGWCVDRVLLISGRDSNGQSALTAQWESLTEGEGIPGPDLRWEARRYALDMRGRRPVPDSRFDGRDDDEMAFPQPNAPRSGVEWRVRGISNFFPVEGGYLFYDVHEVAVSDAALAGTFAAPPLLWVVIVMLRSMRGKRRKGKLTCEFCGYDLRATPDRCPECGTAAKGAAT